MNKAPVSIRLALEDVFDESGGENFDLLTTEDKKQQRENFCVHTNK